jgi:peptidoglycan/LPS O-acetylase OafA/YrhL
MITPSYRYDLDGLRGIAVIMAVTFHAFPGAWPGGFIGVEIFFVVSGFLIGTILLQSVKDGSFTYREFYARRVRRIFPALAVMLGAVLWAGWYLLLGDEYRQLGKHVVAGAGFFSNLAHWSEVGYFDKAAETKPLLHLWSLGVEEQFYIVLPPLLLLIHRLRLNTRATVGVLWLMSFALNLWLTSFDRTQAFYSPVPRLWELLTGCLLASYSLDPYPKLPQWFSSWRANPRLQNMTALAGLLLILIPSALLDRFSHFPGGWTLLPVFGTAMLIAVGDRALINRHVLANRVLAWVGLISYPLYLWHWPLLSIAHTMQGEVPAVMTRAVLVTLSVILAWLTYRFVETPLRFGRWRRMAVPLASAIMVLLALAAALVWQGYAERVPCIGAKRAKAVWHPAGRLVSARWQ